MKVLIIYAQGGYLSDIAWAFVQEGHQVVQFEELVQEEIVEEEEKERIFEALIKTISAQKIEACFTWNYIETVSDACEVKGIPYLSWIFDSPLVYMFAKNMYNRCNHFFLFDRELRKRMEKLKLEHLYHLPLAINSLRLSAFEISDEALQEYKRDLSFVGSLYLDNQFDAWTPLLPDQVLDKAAAMFERQFNHWDRNIIYDEMEKGLLEDFKKYTNIDTIHENYPYMSDMMMYGGMIVMRKYAQIERICILNALAEYYPVTLYTESNASMLRNVEVLGHIDYQAKMPAAFYASKINLNITMRSIESGVPLRVFDIMGSAGFALTNYQSELEDYFEPDKDLAVYHSIEELIDKAGYYLHHEKERIRILANGYRKVHAEHNFRKRVAVMMEAIGG